MPIAMEQNENIKWHPAFYGGMELEFLQYKGELSFEQEHSLSKEPLRMDLLIIKNILEKFQVRG